MKSNELENRLIAFSVNVINRFQEVENNFALEHLVKQIIRSSTSPALYHVMAQNAKSTVEFENNMKVGLKELRATLVNLKIQKGIQNISDIEELQRLINENNELIEIFVNDIKTSKNKNKNIGF
ncbi:four helix bundle protein [Kordia sp.]|uniref:four helix bundle protein n=1 Tax=Kordia sp. TaxID=1965332 RepID=UPI0025BCD2D0|nr:four helix bundle protein [Kordia sp.]MCH2195184.1 four helix bundle protein [Kordia sp.]